MASRSIAPNASDGSRTMTITERSTQEEGPSSSSHDQGSGGRGEIVGSVRVKAKKKPANGQRVAWDEGVVDNEGCGRKKSKICCIYHKPRRFDESSSESESDSDDDASDTSFGDGGARPSSGMRGNRGGPNRNANHNHNHGDCGHEHPTTSTPMASSSTTTTVIHTPEEREPNAYERQPKGKKKA
ncbi:hypothetical protein CVT24_008831 [Panaeolus cyanescens]|uniref:Type 1 phosphatases regulator n=1 Tax=Panaeolus cyanescens TaxID=181874 RepID=A0A409VKA2_9AGAR|nr:hypothetical protein CVT24_008831 [Panaeolus cyanescens]